MPVELATDIVPQDDLGGLAVLFVHGEEKQREHHPDHQERRPAVPQHAASKDVGRNADRDCRAEADQLAFCEVQRDFGLDLAEVFGYVYKSPPNPLTA